MTTLKDYLKQYSVIPNKFIDEFLSMYNPDTIQTDFAINLDSVAKWLSCTKGGLVGTLTNSYTQNIDYTISKARKNLKYGGNHYQLIMITPDCFKRLCMRSNSKRAEEVRTYFIQLESLLVKYKSFIIEGMRKEQKEYEKALRPRSKEDHAGYIYVLKASPKNDMYKIGQTQDLYKRLATYKTGSLEEIEPVLKFRTDNYKKTEACLKLMLDEAKVRKYREIYEINIDVIKMLIEKCDGMAANVRVWTSNKPSKLTGGYYMCFSGE